MKSDLSRNQISPNEGNETWEAALSQGEGVGEEAVALPTKAHEEARQKLLGEVKIQKRKCKLPAIFPAQRKKVLPFESGAITSTKLSFRGKLVISQFKSGIDFPPSPSPSSPPLPQPLLSTCNNINNFSTLSGEDLSRISISPTG